MQSMTRPYQFGLALALALSVSGTGRSSSASDSGMIEREQSPPGRRADDGPGEKPAATKASAASPGKVPRFSAAVTQAFHDSCASCHDLDGRGETGRETLPGIPDFTNAKWQSTRTDAQLGLSILDGKGKSMPRMKKKLGKVDVGLMVALVRAFRDGGLVVEDGAVPAQPAEKAATKPGVNASSGRSNAIAAGADGKGLEQPTRLFQKSCALCHGRDGKGDTARESLPSIPNFGVADWHRKRTNALLVVSILDGKGTGMPAFRQRLSREQARELVTYIRTFAPGTATVASSGTDEFERRYSALAREFDELARQIGALSKPASTEEPKPTQSQPTAKKQ